MAGISAIVSALTAIHAADFDVHPLQEYHAAIRS
jgi:hypothetical protein